MFAFEAADALQEELVMTSAACCSTPCAVQGCGILEYDDPASAAAAMNALHTKYLWTGGETTMVVEWMDPARRHHKDQPTRKSGGCALLAVPWHMPTNGGTLSGVQWQNSSQLITSQLKPEVCFRRLSVNPADHSRGLAGAAGGTTHPACGLLQQPSPGIAPIWHLLVDNACVQQIRKPMPQLKRHHWIHKHFVEIVTLCKLQRLATHCF
jgi:hypothetical protein